VNSAQALLAAFRAIYGAGGWATLQELPPKPKLIRGIDPLTGIYHGSGRCRGLSTKSQQRRTQEQIRAARRRERQARKRQRKR
jgi:hypothetical protein